MHDNYVGYVVGIDASGHNEHAICTWVMDAIRTGKRIRREQADDSGRYVDARQPYWFQRYDRTGAGKKLVNIKSGILPYRDDKYGCG